MAHMLAEIGGTFRFAFKHAEGDVLPWHDAETHGIRVPRLLTPDESLTVIGADVPVIEAPLVSHGLVSGTHAVATGRKALWRVDGDAEGMPQMSLMGDVGADYGTLQYSATLDVFRALFGDDTPCVDTVGMLDAGERFFASARMKECRKPVGTKGDEIISYLLTYTGHDGSTPRRLLFGNIRPVCHNTVTANVKGARNMIVVRHTSGSADAMKQADEIMIAHAKQQGLLLDAFRAMAEDNVTVERTARVLSALFPDVTEDDGTVDAARRANVNAKARRNRVLSLFEGDADGADMAGRTAWGLWNAIVQYLDREDGEDGDAKVMTASRWARSTFNGPTVAKRQAAFALLSSAASAAVAV